MIPAKYDESIEKLIAMERIRQARRSFDLALVVTAACAFVGLGGVLLLFTSRATEGFVSTTGGLAATVRCLQLAKDANDRLDRLLAETVDEL